MLERLAKGLEHDRLLLELIVGSLPAHTLREIEDEMDPSTTPLLSNWSKQRIAQGRALGKREGLQKGRQEGRRQALLLVLRSRGLRPAPAQLRLIESCTDSRRLATWLRRAAVVQSVEQLVGRAGSRAHD